MISIKIIIVILTKNSAKYKKSNEKTNGTKNQVTKMTNIDYKYQQHKPFEVYILSNYLKKGNSSKFLEKKTMIKI